MALGVGVLGLHRGDERQQRVVVAGLEVGVQPQVVDGRGRLVGVELQQPHRLQRGDPAVSGIEQRQVADHAALGGQRHHQAVAGAPVARGRRGGRRGQRQQLPRPALIERQVVRVGDAVLLVEQRPQQVGWQGGRVSDQRQVVLAEPGVGQLLGAAVLVPDDHHDAGEQPQLSQAADRAIQHLLHCPGAGHGQADVEQLRQLVLLVQQRQVGPDVRGDVLDRALVVLDRAPGVPHRPRVLPHHQLAAVASAPGIDVVPDLAIALHPPLELVAHRGVDETLEADVDRHQLVQGVVPQQPHQGRVGHQHPAVRRGTVNALGDPFVDLPVFFLGGPKIRGLGVHLPLEDDGEYCDQQQQAQRGRDQPLDEQRDDPARPLAQPAVQRAVVHRAGVVLHGGKVLVDGGDQVAAAPPGECEVYRRGAEHDRPGHDVPAPQVREVEEPGGDQHIGPSAAQGLGRRRVVWVRQQGVIDVEPFPDLPGEVLLLNRALEDGDPLAVQVADAVNSGVPQREGLQPGFDHRYRVEFEPGGPLVGVGDVEDEIQLAALQPFQVLVPGAADVFDVPALVTGDGVDQVHEQALGPAVAVPEHLGTVLVDPDRQAVPGQGRFAGPGAGQRQQQG